MYGNIWSSEESLNDSNQAFAVNSNNYLPHTIIEASKSSSYAVIYIRSFDLTSTNSYTPALESFLETYSPPISEDEVFSDANSFDVLNPLSYNGEFEMVYFDVTSETFDVPSGKSLIVQSMSKVSGNGGDVYVNGVNLLYFADGWSYGSVWNYFNNTFILISED